MGASTVRFRIRGVLLLALLAGAACAGGSPAPRDAAGEAADVRDADAHDADAPADADPGPSADPGETADVRDADAPADADAAVPDAASDAAVPDAAPDAAADAATDPGPLPDWPARPALAVDPADKAAILARLDGPPWDDFLARIRATAATPCTQDTNAAWNGGVHRRNADVAQANAVLAWLLDDAGAAAKVRDCFADVRTDWDTSQGEDQQMAGYSIPFAVAWDLLAGTPFFPAADAADARARLLAVNDAFYDRVVGDDLVRWTTMTVTQNNIPMRVSAALAYTALTFPDAPRSRQILDFGAGEEAYLWSPDGRYVEDDGVVSEEPFYFGNGFPPALAFFLAMRHAWPAGAALHRNCVNRNDVDPWAPIDCTDGQPYLWEDPLAPPGANAHADRLWSAFDWSLDHRLPSGRRSTTGDGLLRLQNAGPLLAALSGRGRYAWDAHHNDDGTTDLTKGLDLVPQHLFEIAAMPDDTEPPWTSRAHLVSGHATLRSGWGPDDLWILVLGESGPARKTLHDHADGTSYALAAYGEYLLIDAGYLKPNPLDNSVTADAPSHNVVLIDGQGAPDRGLLNDWGDADASMDRFVDGDALDQVEVEQSYRQSTIRREVVMVRDRYAVVADRLTTQATAPREHAWRVNGFAGYDSGGTYALDAQGATFMRPKAGIRVAVASTAGEPAIVEPPFVAGAAPHAHSLGEDAGSSAHAVADAVVTALAPGFLAILAPYQVGAADGTRDAPLAIERLASGDGSAAWAVTGVDGTDVVWLRAPGAPGTLDLPGGGTIATDADLVVANADDGLLLVRGGSGATVDGVARTPPTVADGLRIAEPGTAR